MGAADRARKRGGVTTSSEDFTAEALEVSKTLLGVDHAFSMSYFWAAGKGVLQTARV